MDTQTLAFLELLIMPKICSMFLPYPEFTNALQAKNQTDQNYQKHGKQDK